jgi:hypothetical protein
MDAETQALLKRTFRWLATIRAAPTSVTRTVRADWFLTAWISFHGKLSVVVLVVK